MFSLSNPVPITLFLIVMAIMSACGGGTSGGTTSTIPTSLIFVSGSEISVNENNTLTGYSANATDAEGDSITYSITGGMDQGLFKIDNNSGVLVFLVAPDFELPTDNDINNTYVVEITATDGTNLITQTVTITVTNVVNEAVPIRNMGFSNFRVTTELPSIVSSAFRVFDKVTGKPIIGLIVDDFQIFEDGIIITKLESFSGFDSIDKRYYVFKTVLALDISSSLSVTDIQKVKNSAKALIVDPDTGISNLVRGQQVAIYTFDGNVTRIIDFTNDDVKLVDAINTISGGGPATNLYGAIIQGANAWQDNLTLKNINYGAMLIVTNGNDNSGIYSELDAINAVGNKLLFVIPVGSNVNIPTLENIAGVNQIFTVSDYNQLGLVFGKVASELKAFPKGLNLLYYASPKRNGSHTVDISIVNNDNIASDNIISANFDASTFSDVTPEVVVFATGATILPTNEFVVTPSDTVVVEAELRWSNVSPNFEFKFVDLVGTQPMLTKISPSTESFQIPGTFVEGKVQVDEINTVSTSSSYFIRDIDGDGILDRNDFFPQDSTRWSKDRINIVDLDGRNGFTLNGIDYADLSGTSVKNVGDINADGIDDFAISAIGGDWGTNNNTGEIYVVFGNNSISSSVIELSSLNGSNGFVIYGAFNDLADAAIGSSFSSAGDVNDDGIDDLIIGSNIRNSNANLSTISNVYIVYGKKDNWLPTLNLSLLNISSGYKFQGDYVGRSVSGAGDINADGISDIIFGGLDMYVIFGVKGGWLANFTTSSLNGTNGFVLIKPSNIGVMSVDALGDVTKDGIDDLILGLGTNIDFSGAAVVLYGRSTVWPASLGINPSALGHGFNGFPSRSQAGFSVSSAGDINGDGLNDLIIGAPNTGSSTDPIGSAYVVFGVSGGWLTGIGGYTNLTSLDGNTGFKLTGAVDGQAGFSVSGGGDINGDGYSEIIIGDLKSKTSYVVFGNITTWPKNIDLTSLDGINGFVINSSGNIGKSVSIVGDINGDGIDDILVGDSQVTIGANKIAGQSYIIYGCNYTTRLCIK